MSPRSEHPEFTGMPTPTDWVAFVDESGDHSLESVDANFPVFALSMCLCRWDQYLYEVVPNFKYLKLRYFGHDNAVLHEADLVKVKGIIKDLGPERRKALLQDLTSLIQTSQFRLIGVVINKRLLKSKYPSPTNPYALAIEFALERATRFLDRQTEVPSQLTIIAESRGKREDAELRTAFQGVVSISRNISRRIQLRLVFVEKHMNSEGLQLADLTARPIAQSVLRPMQPNRTYEVLKTKYLSDAAGSYQGIGLKVFP